MNVPDDVQSSTIEVPFEREDALMPNRAKRKKRRHRPRWLKQLSRYVRKGRWISGLIFIIALIVVLAVGALALVTDARNRIDSSLLTLERDVTALSRKPGTELTLVDFDRLRGAVRSTADTLAAARQQIGFVNLIAPYNNELNAQMTALTASEYLARSAGMMLNGLQPTLFYMVSGDEQTAVVTQISSGERIVELLGIGMSEFDRARLQINVVRDMVDNVDLSQVSNELIITYENLDRYIEQLTQVSGVLMGMPDLLNTALGLGGEQNYLILSQNSDELRPSGGYIGTYGWMTVEFGRVTDYNYSPTTATSPNPPTRDYTPVSIPDWWIPYERPEVAAWDGSWYPDFAITAQMAADYYNAGRNPQSPVRGVIGIDTYGFEMILGALGEVTVEGYDVTVTPENFRQLVYDVRAFGRGSDPHKQFIAAIYREIFTRWQGVDATEPTTNGQLLGALLQALQEKHVMLYFADENLNAAVDLLRWGGQQIPAEDHDYLLVADANLGNKSNRSVTRSLTYDVDIQTDRSVRSRLTVNYNYPASLADIDPAVNPEFHGPIEYNNLLQVFAPPGSILDQHSGDFIRQPRLTDYNGYGVLASWLTVPYDSSQRFQFSYTTPPIIERYGANYRYRLTAQKQPGTAGDPLSVQINLPEGAWIVSTTPEPDARYELQRSILEFRLSLTSDQTIEIIYGMSSASALMP